MEKPNIVEMFIGYMIDHCEREIITEEFLQRTYSDFLKAMRKCPECGCITGTATKCEPCSVGGA